SHDNQEILLDIIKLMHEKVRLLGYENYARFALEKRMAETPARVTEFLNRLLDASMPAAKKEIEEVRQLARSLGLKDELQPWDFTFYSEKLKEQRYSYDEEMLRPYFPLDKVVVGVMEHAHRLYGLVFEKSDKYPLYHP